MQQHDTSPVHAGVSLKERVGLVVAGADARSIIAQIVAAEAAGVRQVWITQGSLASDSLTLFAVAMTQTSSIRMGTAIVPTYPRHPLALVQQTVTIEDIAPGRLRLGVGPSHRPVIEGVYGIPMQSPLAHEREYVEVLRGALWDGKVDVHGTFFNVKATLPRTPRTPILISALREGAFQMAGEISDGAISWVCPAPYLLERALPALIAGAAKKGRPAPPLVAHIPVALSTDRPAILQAARRQLSHYGKLPFYASMFAQAGFPVAENGVMSDALFDSLVVSGDEVTVASRVKGLLTSGLDELLLMPIGVANPEDEQQRLARLIGQL